MDFEKLSVYVRTSEILQEHIPSGLYADDFSQSHTQTLITELARYFDFEYLLECKDEVRRAIKEYFADTHEEIIVIFHKNREIIVREKSSIERKKFNRLVLEAIKKFLAYNNSPFTGGVNGEALQLSSLKIKSFQKLLNLNNKQLFKKVMKEATKRFLKLEDTEQVVCINGLLYVKLATDNMSEKRFFSIPSKEFQKIQDKYFIHNIFPLIEDKLFYAFDHSIDFRKITNEKFSKIYIKSFYNIVHSVIKPILKDEDRAVVKHFTNFMLRKYFDEMMIVCAQELSRHTLDHNKNAEKFFLYYDGGLIANKDGQIFSKPVILRSDGNQYELAEIFSLITRYELILSKVKHQKELIKIAEKNVLDIEAQKSSLEIRQRKQVDELAEFERQSKKSLKSIERKKQHRLKLKERQLSTEELSIIKRKDLLDNQSESLNIAIKKYKKDRTRVKKELKAEETKALIIDHELASLSHDYFEAIKAIARAMAKKPEPVTQDSRRTITK